MFAVEGIFDGTAVQLNTAELPVRERYRVVVTFLNPTGQMKAFTLSEEDGDSDEPQEAFHQFLKYTGTQPVVVNEKSDYEIFQESIRLLKDSHEEDELLPDEFPRVHFTNRLEI